MAEEGERGRGREGGARSQEFPQTDRQASPDFADPTCGAISATAARYCRRLWPGPDQVRASVTGMARRATAPASYRGRPSLPGTERYPSPAPSGHTGQTHRAHRAHGADTQGTRVSVLFLDRGTPPPPPLPLEDTRGMQRYSSVHGFQFTSWKGGQSLIIRL